MREYFGKYRSNYLKEFITLYIDILLIRCMFCANILLGMMWEESKNGDAQ